MGVFDKFTLKNFLLIAVPVFLAWFTKECPEYFLSVLPKPLDAWVFTTWHGTKKYNDPDYWATMPMINEILPTPLNIYSKKDIFHPKGQPTLMKDFVTVPDLHETLDFMRDVNHGKDFRVFNYTHLTDHIAPNCMGRKKVAGGGQLSQLKMKFEDYDLENDKNLFVGFESVTADKDVSTILGFDIETFFDDGKADVEYRSNNLFFHNFDGKIISSTFHCAPVESLAIMASGHKTWLFFSPEQLAKLQALPVISFLPAGYTDDELFDALSEIRIAHQGPGDALYFGANWCHAVISQPGPTIMFTLRYSNPMKFLWNQPLHNTARVLLRRFTRGIARNPEENAELHGPIYEALVSLYDGCGLSNRVKQFVEWIEWHDYQ